MRARGAPFRSRLPSTTRVVSSSLTVLCRDRTRLWHEGLLAVVQLLVKGKGKRNTRGAFLRWVSAMLAGNTTKAKMRVRCARGEGVSESALSMWCAHTRVGAQPDDRMAAEDGAMMSVAEVMLKLCDAFTASQANKVRLVGRCAARELKIILVWRR